MHVLVTGAGGFIGAGLVDHMHRLGATVTAVDVGFPAGTTGHELLKGSIADDAVQDAAFATAPDVIFHLASVPGGMAEADYALGHAINVEATFDLFHRAAALPRPPAMIFASSIAVYGADLPDHVTDASPPRPASSYGTAKLMAELLLADLTRRGAVHGMSLRLPGIVARPAERNGAVSIFLSDLIRELPQGFSVICPVSPEARVWIAPQRLSVEHLAHAASIAKGWTGPSGLLLPALHCTIGELVDGISARAGRDLSELVTYAPVPAVEALFGRYPPMSPDAALKAGFASAGSIEDVLRLCA